MPRLMSFALTREQILDRSKTVTRRLGWEFLKPGDRLTACAKVMGRKKGEPLDRLAELRVVSVWRERLDLIDAPEVAMEGFPDMPPEEFVRMFCDSMGCAAYADVTRIEFEYVADARKEGE